MIPAGTVKPRAPTGTAGAERTDRAVGSEHLFIIEYQPFLKA